MPDKKRKKDAPHEPAAPFFARYLESQETGAQDAEAEVSDTKARANAVAKSGGKTKAAAAKPIPAQTLKYPSDRDEWVLYPYHVEAVAGVKLGGGKKQTLKYPSDSDESEPYFPVYIDEDDVPKTTTAKPKEANIRLTRKRPKGSTAK